MTSVLVIYMLLQPVFGALSDRIGRKNNMLLFSGLATLTTVPLLSSLGSVTDSYVAFALVLAALVIASFSASRVITRDRCSPASEHGPADPAGPALSVRASTA
jgi:MFS family permease